MVPPHAARVIEAMYFVKKSVLVLHGDKFSGLLKTHTLSLAWHFTLSKVNLFVLMPEHDRDFSETHSATLLL